MCELALFGIVIAAMVKIADHDGKSPWVWGGVTFGICVLMLMLPLPFLRVILALVVAFVSMIVANAIRRS